MQYFYDGQLRRYLIQIIRMLSNFVVRYGDGTLVRVPVMYGDPERQAANIVNQNSENTLQSCPRIGVYITDLDLDRSRLGDSTFVSKIHLRERAIEVDENGNEYYTSEQGKRHTVERLMPTPFNLTVKVDIWSSSTDQKLQLLEQILVLFNPSLEIQTTDNFVDWTSLTVVELEDVNFSGRSIPVGANSSIDIATITLKTPVYLSPPVKVKKLGVVTKIIANVYGGIDPGPGDYIDGLGTDPQATDRAPSNYMYTQYEAPGDFDIFVEGNEVTLFSSITGSSTDQNWQILIEQYPSPFQPGLSRIHLEQEDGTEVIGLLSYNPLVPNSLIANWDQDSYHSNTYIDNLSYIENVDESYNSATGKGTFDAIISPLNFRPRRPNNENIDQPIQTGIRYLLVDNLGAGTRETFVTINKIKKINTGILYDNVYDCVLYIDNVSVTFTSTNLNGKFLIQTASYIQIGSLVTYILKFNEDGPDAWKNDDDSDPLAFANDIILWTGSEWRTIFNAHYRTDIIVYQTNYYTGTQYKWNGIEWKKSFEGEYKKGKWRLVL